VSAVCRHGAVNKYEEEAAEKPKFTGSGVTLAGQKVEAAAAPPAVVRCALIRHHDGIVAHCLV